MRSSPSRNRRLREPILLGCAWEFVPPRPGFGLFIHLLQCRVGSALARPFTRPAARFCSTFSQLIWKVVCPFYAVPIPSCLPCTNASSGQPAFAAHPALLSLPCPAPPDASRPLRKPTNDAPVSSQDACLSLLARSACPARGAAHQSMPSTPLFASLAWRPACYAPAPQLIPPNPCVLVFNDPPN